MNPEDRAEVTVSDEKVWQYATRVYGLDGLDRDLFEILRDGIKVNPTQVEGIIERANNGKNPVRYFQAALRGTAQSGWDLRAPQAGIATSKLHRAAVRLIENSAHSEAWEVRAEWERYIVPELAEMSIDGERLDAEGIAKLLDAYTGPVTISEHATIRIARQEEIAEATGQSSGALSIEENARRMRHLYHRSRILAAGGEINDDDPEAWGSLAAIYRDDPEGLAEHHRLMSEEECPACDGRGEKLVTRSPDGLNVFQAGTPCPECQGKGIVSSAVREKA